ncbi:hypothetical protein [Actinoplanes cyaneus]|uniref:hypothetical protein n=1 Tax=Actinoplanes cyaneus TaxID=52696 RepID=UPI0019436AC2|nr:hypothetical protein [Actinoplanes cyaneus]
MGALPPPESRACPAGAECSEGRPGDGAGFGEPDSSATGDEAPNGLAAGDEPPDRSAAGDKSKAWAYDGSRMSIDVTPTWNVGAGGATTG